MKYPNFIIFYHSISKNKINTLDIQMPTPSPVMRPFYIPNLLWILFNVFDVWGSIASSSLNNLEIRVNIKYVM